MKAAPRLRSPFMLVLVLEAVVIAFSMLAGLFWMASAYGRTIGPPWRPSKPVPPNLAQHQALWNGRAALCASFAAIAQAFVFLLDRWLPFMTHRLGQQ
jgi:hypothetical protein